MSGNGLATPEIVLAIKWEPANGKVYVSFPQIDPISILGLLEFAKENLREMRAKADSRIAIPDAATTSRLTQ